MDILFNKVFKNSYLRNLILYHIKSQKINYLTNRKSYNDLISLKDMLKNKQYNIIKDKLKSNQNIVVDLESILELIESCKDLEIYQLLFEKKRDHLESVDLIYKSIYCGSVFATETFLKLYDKLEQEEQSKIPQQSLIKYNEKLDKQILKFNTWMFKVGLNDRYLIFPHYLISNRPPIIPKKPTLSKGWIGVFNLYSKKDMDEFIEFLKQKLKYDLSIIIKHFSKVEKINKKELQYILQKIKNPQYLFEFLNKSVISSINGLNDFLQEPIFFLNNCSIDSLKCVLLLNYYKSNNLNQFFKKLESISIEQILIEYQHLPIIKSYSIDYYFQQNKYEKVKPLITGNNHFYHLFYLSFLNFNLDGFKILSEIKSNFSIKVFKDLDLNQFNYKPIVIESQEEIQQFFVNLRNLNLSEFFLNLDFIKLYKNYYTNDFLEIIKFNLQKFIKISQHQQISSLSLKNFNKQLFETILFNNSIGKVINLKLLLNLLFSPTLNNDHLNEDQIIEIKSNLSDLIELNDGSNNPLEILNYLFEKQLLNQFEIDIKLQWLEILINKFNCSEIRLIQLFKSLSIDSELKENQQSIKKLMFNILTKSNDYIKLFVYLFNEYILNRDIEITETCGYILFEKIQNSNYQEYLNSLSIIKKIELGYLENIEKELQQSNYYFKNDTILYTVIKNYSIENFKIIFKIFLSKSYEILKILKSIMDLYRIDLLDQILNDEKLLECSSINNKDRNIIMSFIISSAFSVYNYPTIEYLFKNFNHVFKENTEYSPYNLFRKSLLHGQIPVHKLVLKYFPSHQFKYGKKLVKETIKYNRHINVIKFLYEEKIWENLDYVLNIIESIDDVRLKLGGLKYYINSLIIKQSYNIK